MSITKAYSNVAYCVLRRRHPCCLLQVQRNDATGGGGGRGGVRRRRRTPAAASFSSLPERDNVNGVNVMRERDLLVKLAQQPSTKLSLLDLHSFCSTEHFSQQLLKERKIVHACFLHKELPVRFAKRALELLDLPFQVTPVKLAASWYTNIVKLLLSHPQPVTEELEDGFAQFLSTLLLDQAQVPQAISEGILELRREERAAKLAAAAGGSGGEGGGRLFHAGHLGSGTGRLSRLDRHRIDRVLDEFFTSRIGLRFLIEHYIASKRVPPRPGFSGIIQSKCSPVEVASLAAADIDRACRYHLGMAPPIYVYGRTSDNFTAVPSHLYFILCELLKNSCRATVERHGGRKLGSHERGAAAAGGGGDEDNNASPAVHLPPVRVIIAKGLESVTIKVSDEGGGIKRSDLQNVWSYFFSTAAIPPLSDLKHIPFDDPTGTLEKKMESLGRGPLITSAEEMTAAAAEAAAAAELKISAEEGGGSDSLASSGYSPSWAAEEHSYHEVLAEEEAPPIANEHAFAGYGMGLPLSRLYARYFGGSLKLRPMEGYGTDAYLHLHRLRTQSEEYIPTALKEKLRETTEDGRVRQGRPAWQYR